MRSVPRPAFYLFLAAALSAAMFAPPALAQTKKEKRQLKAQAEALLAKSHDLSNIEAPGSPPFVLNVKIHYQIGPQSAEGDGQIIWTAPDHYREAYTAPNYFYTEIVRDGHRYLSRTKNEMPLVMYELHTTMHKAIQSSPSLEDKIKKVEVPQSDNQEPTCVMLESSVALTDCLDDSGDIVTSERNAPASAAVLDERYEFSDFLAFGTKHFPQKTVFRGGDGHTIEIDVERLALIKDVPLAAFNVPAGAMTEAWCAAPKMTSRLRTQVISLTDPAIGMGATGPLIAANASLYFVIDAKGHARAATVVHSSKPVSNSILKTWMESMTFPRLYCGKEGLEYQLEIEPAP